MKNLEERVVRLKAISELQRIMGSYSYYLSGAQFQNLLALFSDSELVSVTMPWSTYDGPEEISKLFLGLYQNMLCGDQPIGCELQPGVLTIHGMNTPTIDISDDCLTASGTWNSPGLFTVKDSDGANGLQSYWSWQKYTVDFTFESGTWKILKLKADRIFTTPFEKSWTDYKDNPYKNIPKEFLPSESGKEAR